MWWLSASPSATDNENWALLEVILELVIPQPADTVRQAEGRDSREAETFGTKLLVSWENSDKNLSQVLYVLVIQLCNLLSMLF